MKNDFKFYSLLFISKEARTQIFENNYNNKIEVYINNALLLDKH